MNCYYTYILRCCDDTLYTGIALDISRRMTEHFSGSTKCARYTKTHRPKKLEAVWSSENRSTASSLEYRIKQLTKAQKESLILNNDFSIFGECVNSEAYIRAYIDYP